MLTDPVPTAAPECPLSIEPDVRLERRGDGTAILASNLPLRSGVDKVTDWLKHWARVTPDTVFVAHRPSAYQPWREITYKDALARIEALATALITREVGIERPVAILSDNSIEVLLLSLAAMHIGVPVANITSAYSVVASDYSKLKAMVELVTPGLVFADDAARFAKALAAISDLGFETVTSHGTIQDQTDFENLTALTDKEAVAIANAKVGPDTVTRILFTSGSTGMPKGVINTNRMHVTLAEAKTQLWPMLEQERPVIVDWLPWSHTFGANHNLFMVLRNGGSLYIDAGRPALGLIETTIANIRDVRPNFYLNVPRGYDMLIQEMERDESFRDIFFSSVKVVFYAAAALPQNLWDKLIEFSIASKGKPTRMVSAWGSTETSPLATDCHFQAERSGNLGVPIPGVELKLVPYADKLEVRVRGPNVTPGYFRNPELTKKAFDDEGFYLIGDAVKLADMHDPNKGLLFDGRISEDFKLSSATWVNVGALRLRAIAALAPLAQDIVVAGHNSDFIGFLVFPNIQACRQLADLGENASVSEVLAHAAVLEQMRVGLEKLKAEGGGSSSYARTALLLETVPSIDNGEITDKGYINQRRVLELRANLVERLMSPTELAGYIDIG